MFEDGRDKGVLSTLRLWYSLIGRKSPETSEEDGP